MHTTLHQTSLDILECSNGQHNCNINADCKELEGSFSCMCHIGFEGNGVNCQGH